MLFAHPVIHLDKEILQGRSSLNVLLNAVLAAFFGEFDGCC